MSDYSDEIDISIAVLPDFDGYNREGDECMVFDFWALADNLNKDISYYPITCECGMPDDAAIDAPLNQKVSDKEIIWDIPIKDYRWTIVPQYKELDGTLRIIFDKQDFEQTVLRMNNELRSLLKNGIEITTIKPEQFIDLYGGAFSLEIAITNQPHITYAQISSIYPYGGCDNARCWLLSQ
ncbi:hypothetical protein [uncultured Actinobacillus sp.]|uniref:hypothetical protein n=1 Tax=uncultured Actinobacillus sp. TaxID=417616 RepID=UPI0025DE91E7|nr:hypothetical protein [uncultured Actinobacillus sp.]